MTGAVGGARGPRPGPDAAPRPIRAARDPAGLAPRVAAPGGHRAAGASWASSSCWGSPSGSSRAARRTRSSTLTEGERAFQARPGRRRAGRQPADGRPDAGARRSCSEAWRDLERAREGGVPGRRVATRSSATIRGEPGHAVRGQHPRAQQLYATSRDERRVRSRLARGPGQGRPTSSTATTRGLWRVDPKTATATQVVKRATAPSGRHRARRACSATGGADLLIVDDSGNLWRWRPSGRRAAAARSAQIYADEPTSWGDDVTAIDTLPRPRARRTSTTCTSSTRRRTRSCATSPRSTAAASPRRTTTWPPTTRTSATSGSCSSTATCTR